MYMICKCMWLPVMYWEYRIRGFAKPKWLYGSVISVGMARSNEINISCCYLNSHKGRMFKTTSVVACQPRDICQPVDRCTKHACYTHITRWQDAVNWHVSFHVVWSHCRKFLHACTDLVTQDLFDEIVLWILWHKCFLKIRTCYQKLELVSFTT